MLRAPETGTVPSEKGYMAKMFLDLACICRKKSREGLISVLLAWHSRHVDSADAAVASGGAPEGCVSVGRGHRSTAPLSTAVFNVTSKDTKQLRKARVHQDQNSTMITSLQQQRAFESFSDT